MSEQVEDRAKRKAQAVRYVYALDGLRALAAIGVVIIHTESEAKASITTYIVTGAVTGPLFMLFFAITGFVLYRGWARRHLALRDRRGPRRGTADGGSDGRTGKYFLRRLLRIYPLYWVVATAALLVTDAKGHTVGDVIQVYLLSPWPNPDALIDMGLGIVVWTLIIDVVFYLYVALHGAVMNAVIKRFRGSTPFRIETTVLLALVVVIVSSAPFLPGPVAALMCLPMGMWFAVIEAEQDRKGHQLSGVVTMVRAWPIWVGLYLTLGPLVCSTLIGTKDYDTFITDAYLVHVLMCIAGFFLLINVLWGKPHWPLPRMLASPFMRRAGLLTYGTYLWHPVVLIVLHKQLPDGGMAAYQLITVSASLALAAVTYALVERPLARLRLEMRRPEPATAGVDAT